MDRSYSDRLATIAVRFADAPTGSTGARRRWRIADGLICIIAGIITLVTPDRAVGVLAVLLGFALLFVGGWLAYGIIDSRARGARWWAAVLAIASFAVGVCILAYPEVGAVVLVAGAAVWLFIAGAHDIAVAWAGRQHRVISTVTGALSIVIAVGLVIPPSTILTNGTLVIVVGAGLIVRGILLLARSTRRRRSTGYRRRSLDESVPAPATS